MVATGAGTDHRAVTHGCLTAGWSASQRVPYGHMTGVEPINFAEDEQARTVDDEFAVDLGALALQFGGRGRVACWVISGHIRPKCPDTGRRWRLSGRERDALLMRIGGAAGVGAEAECGAAVLERDRTRAEPDPHAAHGIDDETVG